MSEPDDDQKPSPLQEPNAHVSALIVASLTDPESSKDASDGTSRTELDSHANMFVAGKHVFILADSGTTATV